MANEKRLIFLEDAIEKIVNVPSKVAHDAFYGRKQFTPMQMLTVVADRQHEIIDLLKMVKEVDVAEVVHGRWVNPYINRYGHPCHCCSECGFKASYQDKNYCPNCGAKMDEERK